MESKNIINVLNDWVVFIIWITITIIIVLSFKNESIGIEYKMTWFLLALLGFTISNIELNKG